MARKTNSQTPPPRFRPIVFVSHSAREDPDSHASLKAIEAQLEKAGFEILLDETRLKGGERWENCLHTWMGHCHGAILLLTPKALQSPWVLKEATILSWRNSLSAPGEFLLVPVLLGISPSDLAANAAFAPLNLPAVQAVVGLEGAPLAKALVALFQPLLKVTAKTPRRLLEEKIANLLMGVRRRPILTEVMNLLNEDLRGWDADRDVEGTLAALLLQAPFEKLGPALQPLAGVLPAEALETLVQILRPSWVNPDTAAMLTLVARKAEGKRAAALNASETDFTAKSVIARASVAYPCWKYIPVSNAAGEDQSGSALKEIRAGLARLAGSSNPKIIEAYVRRRVRSEPAVIVLPPPDPGQPLPDESFVRDLLREHPLCTLFMLTGTTMPPEGTWAGVQRLTPPLAADDESDAFVAFQILRQQVNLE